jgi:hypothetical protein
MTHEELINTMLQNIEDDRPAEAQQNFNDLMSAKINAALDDRKQQIAMNFGSNNSDDTEN